MGLLMLQISMLMLQISKPGYQFQKHKAFAAVPAVGHIVSAFEKAIY